jgi:hypothetical protein
LHRIARHLQKFVDDVSGNIALIGAACLIVDWPAQH